MGPLNRLSISLALMEIARDPKLHIRGAPSHKTWLGPDHLVAYFTSSEELQVAYRLGLIRVRALVPHNVRPDENGSYPAPSIAWFSLNRRHGNTWEATHQRVRAQLAAQLLAPALDRKP